MLPVLLCIVILGKVCATAQIITTSTTTNTTAPPVTCEQDGCVWNLNKSKYKCCKFYNTTRKYLLQFVSPDCAPPQKFDITINQCAEDVQSIINPNPPTNPTAP